MISRRSLTANVFARAYERWGQLRDQSAVTWWLFGIARNCIAGYFRRRERESSRQARLESLAGDGFSDDFPVAAAELSYDVERLKTFICRLTAADQELISLRFDAALTSAEIAKIPGISQQNVRVRIFWTLRRLRELMTSQAATAQSTATPKAIRSLTPPSTSSRVDPRHPLQIAPFEVDWLRRLARIVVAAP